MKTILITAAIFLAAEGLASADSAKNNFSGMMVGNEMMNGMMQGSEEMSEMMKNHHGGDGMGCMEMMENSESMSAEEKEKMLADMDENGDGKCDMCGMDIEMCRSMMGL